MKQTYRAVQMFFASVMLTLAAPAFAIGGLDKANDLAQQIQTGAYALLGTGASLYLIYMVLMAFTEKKTWADFGWAVVYVCIAGAVLALASWAWSAFS